MLDQKRTAAYIAEKRKAMGLTQQQVADRLNVSFQAVSKWENGLTFPSIDVFYALSKLLDTTIDEMLDARDNDDAGYSYSRAGVDITYTDAIKDAMREHVASGHPRVLGDMGAFASLYDIAFEDISQPVLVLKAEEPGSKQKLAVEYGCTESICHDMINHLVNDIAVMGATPLAVLDTIVCGSAESDTIKMLVKGIADACRHNDCVLMGGETSIQPGVLEKGRYILTASVAGLVDRRAIIDGSRIKPGDRMLAIASNGLHTNGYSLVRMMMEQLPALHSDRVDGQTFLEALMAPHTAYYPVIRHLFKHPGLHGMAHITGGGIAGNLPRILPAGTGGVIDLAQVNIPAIFRHIKLRGNITDAEMLRTFNCGVGLILVVDALASDSIAATVSKACDCYEIGEVVESDGSLCFHHALEW